MSATATEQITTGLNAQLNWDTLKKLIERDIRTQLYVKDVHQDSPGIAARCDAKIEMLTAIQADMATLESTNL